ncbi:MAG: hypothetical protein R2939_12000 [Kofleriaceae bacterium]
MRRLAIPSLAVIALATPAQAHVAPSLDGNNRYLKATPLADQVRLAYTIYFGERPGALTRRGMDTDRDGALSDAEVAAFGRTLGEQVAAALEVTVDDRAVPVRWSSIDAGLGAPVVAAGSFAVDLVAWLCTGPGAQPRELRVRDRFVLPLEGETGLRVEDAPGITVSAIHVGRDRIGDDTTLKSAASALSAEGWRIQFQAGAGAARGAADRCPRATAPARASSALGIGAAAGVIGLAGVAGVALWWRRRSADVGSSTGASRRRPQLTA